jgi:hypothetical protein
MRGSLRLNKPQVWCVKAASVGGLSPLTPGDFSSIPGPATVSTIALVGKIRKPPQIAVRLNHRR